MTREKILQAVKANQPGSMPLPSMNVEHILYSDLISKFEGVLTAIGGMTFRLKDNEEIQQWLQLNVAREKRIVSFVNGIESQTAIGEDPHHLANVEVAVLQAEFCVAENGAVWITDHSMGDRALPFIAQHLVIVVEKNSVVATMHDAYQRIHNDAYSFGTFIAGPSKTADIEQSLVLGAHGPKSCVIIFRE